MEVEPEKLREILVEPGFVSKEEFNKVQKLARKQDRKLRDVLVEKNYITDAHLGRLVAESMGTLFVDLSERNIPEEVLTIIPEEVAENQKVITFKQDKEGLRVAMNNPQNREMVRWLEKKTGRDVVPYYATKKDINEALDYYRQGYRSQFEDTLKEQIERAKQEGLEPQDLPIIKIVDSLLEYAYANEASDIHIEPHGDQLVVRFRIDGVLHDIIYLPAEIKNLVVTRIKVLAQLRTDEHHAAQDGKFSKEIEGERFDVRVSVVPITGGEKVAMRLLSEKAQQFALEDLGLQGWDLEKLEEAIERPHGMILVTGPTGSGKTTTLYSILKILNDPEVNVSTIEDPVEYNIERVNQIQVNASTNLTFARGLRSIVRQDPDMIMVGEIRDQETANIAVNAAMTGHLVLSSLHTNDAPTAFPRLMEMGLEPFLVASSVNIIIAQRLVRRVCRSCMQSYKISASELSSKYPADFLDRFEELYGKQNEYRLYRGKGCKVCGFTGYKGRVGIFEVLKVTEAIKKMVMEEANSDEIKRRAMEGSYNRMIRDGVRKVKEGSTTIDEVLRVTRA